MKASAALEQDLLQLVGEFARELHPGRRVVVTPTSSFERDLAIDSLGRVELLSRIERRLGVVFPEEAAAGADRLADLLAVARAATPGARAAERAPLAPALLEALPHDATTIPDVLRWHAARHPERVLVHHLDDDGVTTLTCGALLAGAAEVAAGLQAGGLRPGEAVSIMLPTSLDYFRALHGVLLAGGVPVPIYPPQRLSQIEEHVRREAKILSNAQVRVLITVEEGRRLRPLLVGHAPTLKTVVTVAELEAAGGQLAEPQLDPADVALLQYTSGSTGDPKGVVLTHANLLANVRAMGEAVQATSTDVFVSWLPLYHDMGLIGACLATLYHGCPLVLMSPVRFLTGPQRWLRAIHHYGGTLSAAPNFAYEICATKIPDAELEGLDLSSWRLAFNGAEPVFPGTIERFSQRLAPCGFRATSMFPVYGLAESSVGLAFPPLGRGPVVDRVQREAFAAWRQATPAADDDPDPLTFVGCGRAIPGHELRVVGDDGSELPEREEGRVQFRGPSATAGYFRNPAATARLISDGWLESGDNGYVAEGELYVTGRSKDLIIKGGRNLYPSELEAVVGEVPGVRKGCVAVFGVVDPQRRTERLVIVAETRARDPEARERLQRAIGVAASDVLGSPPDEVLVVPPHGVPKTSSGKIRRAACRELYLRGELGAQRAVRWQLARLWLSGLPGRLRRAGHSLSEKAYAGWAWGVTVAIAPGVWLLIPVLPAGGRQALTRGAVRLGLKLVGIPFEVEALEPEQPAPCVYVANHASYLDALVLAAALPPGTAFAVKGELEKNLFVRWHLRLLGHVFVERFDPQRRLSAVDALEAVVRDGRSLAVFVEGTFGRAPGLRPFHTGAFAVAARTGAAVIPVALRGTRSILRDVQWFPRRGRIKITIGRALCPAGSAWEEVLRLRDAARAAILPHCGEPDLAAEPIDLPPQAGGA